MNYEVSSRRPVESGYRSSAEFQDFVYHDLPYLDEAMIVTMAIQDHFHRPRTARLNDIDMLELGCGTGNHMRGFYNCGFRLHGLDNSPDQLAVAQRGLEDIVRSRNYRARPEEHPSTGVPLHEQDMLTFKLDKKFHAIVCIGSIGNCLTFDELEQCLTNAAEHLLPGGVFIANGSWASGLVQAKPRYYRDENLLVLRTGRNHREGRVVNVTHQYLADVGVKEIAGEGIFIIEENFSFALYDDEEYLSAFRIAGLEIDKPVRKYPFKTPLFIGRKPADHLDAGA